MSPGDEDDNEVLAANGCGVERWAVKTGTDSAASTVNMTPEDTTIQALGALPVPSGLNSSSARFPNTAETQVFRLTNVTLVEYKLETDSDYHLVLHDSAGHSMVAEIPAPGCVSGGTWGPAITASRNAFNAKYTASGSFQSANVPVTVTGAGFFDLAHGQTGAAPNVIELHAILSICFPGSSVSGCAASTPDFSIAASPASVSGATASSTVSVTGSGGFTGSVALSASGLPAGASASFSPASVAAGASSALTLSAGSAAAGTYTVTITGVSGTNTHTASLSWTVPVSTGGAIVNGGFESGLGGWTTAGTTSNSTVAHGGASSAQVGSTTFGSASSLAQTFTAPSAGPLSFWYQGFCNDMVQYAWANASLKDNTAGTTATLLANTCTKSGAWGQVTSGALIAGHSYTLTLGNQSETYQTDYNYTLFDDVQVAGGASPDFTIAASPASVSGSGSSTISVTGANGFSGSVTLAVSGAPSGASAALSATSVSAGGASTLTLTPGSAAAGSYTVTVTGTSGALSHSASVAWTVGGSTGGNVVVNGTFETGSLGSWSSSGSTSVVSSGAHAGTYAARVGSTSPTTDSAIAQTVTLPTGSPQLSFWYKVVCPDTVSYDWATVTVKNSAGSVLTTPLGKTCTNNGAWVQKTADLSAWAGQTVVLSLNNHDDNYSADPTYTLYDDVQITGGSAPAPDFSLTASPASVSSTGSASAAATVTVTPANGFSSAVSLSASGVPSGASASFSPASVSSGNSTLTLSPGTAANGTYALTISGTGGGLTHTAALSWTLSSAGGTGIQTVFIILEENHNWSSISGSASAPYINNTLLPQASYALNYQNLPNLHPSLPNYFWLEAGTNFGVTSDGQPATYHQSSTAHLVTQLQNAGISWKNYSENISGTTCPLTDSGTYLTRHDPMIFFNDVTNTNNASSANCIAHVRPFSELATDLANNTAPRYVFITPNACDDGHNSSGCATTNSVANTDNWLAANIPTIMNSAAYRNNGAIFITWDESEGGNVPIGMIVLSPKAKGHGYTNSITYTHSSTLRTFQEIFAVQPFLGGAASSNDLSDLFTSFP